MDWESEVDPKDTASLRNIALDCERNLRKLLQDEEAQEDIVKDREGYWASRQCAEFNLWCVKVGVNGEGLRSIDVRLKDVPGIYELLRQLLQSLEHDLKELQQPANAPGQICNIDDNADDSESDASSLSFMSLASSDHSEVEGAVGDVASASQKRNTALQRHIEDTIDRLHSHALQIDRAGFKHRQQRMELYRQKDGPRWAYEGFKELASRAAKSHFPLASDTFRQRMAKSFARRRIRFEYLMEHQKKRAVDISHITVQTQASPAKVQSDFKDTDGPSQLAKTQEAPKTANISAQCVPQDQQTIYSATVNTKLDMLPQPRRQERAESVVSVALRHPGFPPPPQLRGASFQCPYCRLEFRACEAEKDRWSQHVIQDFEPYFCILEECKAPFDVPNSFDGLLGHLQGHLDERYHVDMPDGEHKELDETEFENYLAQHGEMSTEMLAIMKKASRRKGPFLFESCPFCGGYPDVFEKRFPNPDTPEAQKELRKHIKQHMQDIAFFLPPYREDILNEDDDPKGSVVTCQSADQSNLGDPDDFKMICDRKDCDCKDKGKYAGDAVLAAESIAITADPDQEEPDFWAELFPNSAPYDTSPVSDEYYLGEKCLQSFIARLSLSVPSVNDRGTKSAATRDPSEHNLPEPPRPSQDCMKSLAFPEMDDGFKNTHAAAKETCKWLLQHETYIEWDARCLSHFSIASNRSGWTLKDEEDAADQSLLWIKGKPGTGKSTLLKYALEHVRDNISRTGIDGLVLSFFFCNHGVELQRTPLGLYRSVLYQILKQIPEALPDLINTFEQRRKESGEPGGTWQWHTEEPMRFFKLSLLKILDIRPVWLFIDALDACGQENAANLIRDFRSLLRVLQPSGLKEFHICFTCPGHLNLVAGGALQICLENENQGDILKYTQDQFSISPMLSACDIPIFIRDQTKGVFTWACLLVKQVLELERNGITLEDIEAEMDSIRPILQVYHKVIETRGSLSWSAGTISEAIVQLLLDKDAERFFENYYKQTPLSWAAKRGHEAIVRLLLEKGANIESKDILGRTSLSWAAKCGHEAIVRLLLEKGANIDSRDNYN